MTSPDGTFDRPGSTGRPRRGRRRVRLLTAGLATAAIAGTGILAAELASQDTATTTASSTTTDTGTSTGDSISSNTSGLGGTSGSDAAHASSGGS
jgi:hypothetical protein